MKKITLTLAIIVFATSLFAQDKQYFTKLTLLYSQEKDVATREKNLEKYKAEIDAMTADAKNATNVELWAWKTTIDAEFANSETLNTKCANCLNSSFDAFKKYEALEIDLKTISEFPFNWKVVGILYDKLYNEGRANYQAKEWEKSYSIFIKVSHFSNIISKKDLRKNGGAIDTFCVLMCAYSAHFANKYVEEINHFSTLIDANYKGENETEIYYLTLLACTNINDKANFEKFYAIAQKKFPQTNFEEYKLNYISKNSSLDEKISTYKTEDSKGNLSADAYLNFGDMFANLSKTEKELVEKDTAKKMLCRTTARDAFKKSYDKSANGIIAFNVGVLYYNEFNDVDDAQRNNIKALQEINSNLALIKDPKKKTSETVKAKIQIDALKKDNANLDAKAADLANTTIEWLEKSVALLKDKAEKTKVEKSSYKYCINNLSNLFAYKRDKSRGKDAKAYDANDAKFKQYEEMYNKL